MDEWTIAKKLLNQLALHDCAAAEGSAPQRH
jgi:hypothetical protein